MQYYQHHIGDYIKDTAHLTVLEDGIYRRLIDLCYTNEGTIVKDIDKIARHIRATEYKETISAILNEFFFINSEGSYSHKRVIVEVRKMNAKVHVARVNGQSGGRPQKTKRVISDNPEKSGSKATHNPLPINPIPTTHINTGKSASPVLEEKPNFTDVRDKIAEGLSFKTTRGITKPWQEEAFRYAKELGMELDDAQKGRWIKLFKETHTLRPYMRKNLQIAYSFLSDLSSFRALDTESKMRYFFNIFYKGPPQNTQITNSFLQA